MFPTTSYFRRFALTPQLLYEEFSKDLPDASKIENEELEILENEYLQCYSTDAEKYFSNLPPLGMVIVNDEQQEEGEYAEDNNNEMEDDDDDIEEEEEEEEEHLSHGNAEEDNSFQMSVLTSSEDEEEYDEDERNSDEGEHSVNPLETFFRQLTTNVTPINFNSTMTFNFGIVQNEQLAMDMERADEEDDPLGSDS